MTTWGLGIEHEFKLKFENLKKIGNYNYTLYFAIGECVQQH